MKVSGGFLIPTSGGVAKRQPFFGGYEVQFSVTNRGDAPITVEADVVTEEIGRGTTALGGKNKNSKHYMNELKDIKPGETRVVDDPGFPTSVFLGKADVTAQLILRVSKTGIPKSYASVSFIVG